jgi:hypothetical protein
MLINAVRLIVCASAQERVPDHITFREFFAFARFLLPGTSPELHSFSYDQP